MLILITTLNGTTHAVPPVFDPDIQTVYIDEDTSLLRTITPRTRHGRRIDLHHRDNEILDSDGDSDTDMATDGDSTFFLLDKDTGRLQLNKKVDFEAPLNPTAPQEITSMWS